MGDSNIFVKDGKVSGFIDLGRSGRADKWYISVTVISRM